MAKKQLNYLDLTPQPGKNITWDQAADGTVTLHLKNQGIFPALARLLTAVPKTSHITLEGQGSYIWPLIDGTNTIYDIALAVKAAFGPEAEPLYERIVQYFCLLESRGYITYSSFPARQQ